MNASIACIPFVHKVIDTYARGETIPFLEASIEPGAEVKIDSITEVTNEGTDGGFCVEDKTVTVNTRAKTVLSCAGHSFEFNAEVRHIVGNLVQYQDGTVLLSFNSPKLSPYWAEPMMALAQKQIHAFSVFAPHLPVVSYVGQLINRVFLDDGNGLDGRHSASDFLHYAKKNPSWVDKVRGWHTFSAPEGFGLFLSLDAPNAGWFDLDNDFNIGKPKEFVREMYLKVMKRRSRFNLTNIYERATAAGLL